MLHLRFQQEQRAVQTLQAVVRKEFGKEKERLLQTVFTSSSAVLIRSRGVPREFSDRTPKPVSMRLCSLTCWEEDKPSACPILGSMVVDICLYNLKEWGSTKTRDGRDDL